MRSFWRATSQRYVRLQYHKVSLLAIRALAIGAMLIAFSTVVRAQTSTGQFNGHVYDQNGAVVPGATVTLVDPQTNLNRTTQTNGEGLYEFPLIPPGLYKLSVDRKSTRLNSSHLRTSRMPSSA